MPLTARTVLVTGASRGLGYEFVKQILQLPKAPEVLIATCRDPSAAKELQALANTNPTLTVLKLDVEKDDDIVAAAEETKKLVGERGLNLLINNAGIYLNKSDGGSLGQQTRERMQTHFNANVSSALIVIQKFLPLIQQAASLDKSSNLNCSRAGIINISSTLGSQTLAYQGSTASLDYMCSKTALTMASILLSQDLKKYGIFVAALHPGWVQTDMGGKAATLTPDNSIKGCLSVIGSAAGDRTGKLLSYDGSILPY